MNTSPTTSETQAALEAGKLIGSLGSFVKLTSEGIPYVVAADGKVQVASELLACVDARAAQPRQIKGMATLLDEVSMIYHVLRFKDGDSALFCLTDKIVAIYDYHRPVTMQVERRELCARWGRHGASYTPVLSPEWVAWVKGAGKAYKQVEFADFIDEHTTDVAGPKEGREVPTAADLATMALTLRVTSEDVLDSTINRTTGEQMLVMKREHNTTGSTKLPREFDIEIPIFEGGARYRIPCAFRFRKSGDGGASFAWVVRGADRLIREAFTDMAKRIAAQTQLPLFMGSPE